MSTYGLFSGVARSALEFVFPTRCVLCGRGGEFVCGQCVESFARATGPRCRLCWALSHEEVCSACHHSQRTLDGVRSAFVFKGGAREVVHGLKYTGQRCLAPSMASLMAEAAGGLEEHVDLIVPVPLYKRRQRVRGFNQSELLARELSMAFGVEYGEPLRRVRDTQPQVKQLSAADRRRNVEGAFSCEGRRIDGRSVLLIDDVTTTGSTLRVCASALREAGASLVVALTFARED